MDAGQTCSTCDAYSGLEKQCRANAPVAFLVQGANGEPVVLGAWPPAQAQHWCRQWKADVNLAKNGGAANDSGVIKVGG